VADFSIQVKALNFKYNIDDVLKQISLEINEGGFISILGPNGSGKTTLLKNICSILKPTEGEIDIYGKTIKAYKHKELAKILAVVHQNSEISFDFTVEEIVTMGRHPHVNKFQGESKMDKAIVERSLKLTETYHLKSKYIQNISGGERQRVMIARALCQQPQILLLDEPISHLDIKYQLEIMKLCRTLNDNKMTILTTLHDINMASRFSDTIVLMKLGEIIEIGSPKKVLTAENIKYVYDVDVEVINVNKGSMPIIYPI